MPIAAQNAANKFIFTPQWTAHAQFAGYYVAKEKGFYKQTGLDVDIIHPSVSQTAENRLRNRESQATTLQLCQAMEIIDNGISLVNILQTSMNNGTVIVSRRDKDPLTQRGARVGMLRPRIPTSHLVYGMALNSMARLSTTSATSSCCYTQTV